MKNQFGQMQQGLANGVFALAMALLVLAWPGTADLQACGLFFASMVVLIHWHFGTSFVLVHFGPNRRLIGSLLDSLMLFALLGLSLTLKKPLIWFSLNALAYLLAWVKYQNLRKTRMPLALSHYVRQKMTVEFWAAAANLGGVAWLWLLPNMGALVCWSSLLGNLAAAWLLSEVVRIYDLPVGVAA